ncbi:MAG TPA: DUF5916 domain-containing protein [Longimicrobiaceae bacterium]|nr:DUF5916 domain-containing protein [Longimicrobiaceae bacterium]
MTVAIRPYLCALLFLPLTAHAQTTPSPTRAASPPTGQAFRVAVGPTIDGRLDESVWSTAEPLEGFVQYEPVEGTPASERTVVRILYDEAALYIGAWLYDGEPQRIIVGERRRDASLPESDAFQIVLDTYRDRQNGFVFGTNPSGIEYDGQVRGEGGNSTNWDGSWTVATSRDGEGWYAEIRIPFSTLRYGAGAEQAWGLNMMRYIGRKNEQVVWSPVARQFGFFRLTEAGVLEGVQPPPRRVTTLTPYVLAAAQRVPPVDPDITYPVELGADAKIGVTQSLSLDLTVNTDFAQVEADDQQLDLSRYSLFFPEKRLFFLENGGLFSTGLDFLPGRTSGRTLMFHSRRIGVAAGQQVPIEYGGRLSGRAAGTNIGLLHMRTGGLDNVQDPAGWTVARVARDLPNRSSVGAIFTSRASSIDAGDWGRTYGVDARIGVGQEWTFTGLAGLTERPGVEGGQEVLSFLGEYLTRSWYLRGYYDQIGRNFSPEAGFVPYTGFREGNIRIERIDRPRASWLREIRTHTRQSLVYDIDSGFKEGQIAHLHTNVHFEDGSVFSPAINWVLEGLDQPFRIRGTDIVVPPGTYTGWNSYANMSTNRAAPVSFNGRWDVGSFLSGNRVGGTAGMAFRQGEALTGNFSVAHNRIRLPQGDFNTTLTRVGLRYGFSAGLFVQSLLQYSDQTGEWSGNVRLGWLDTAGTGLFLVYNERQTMDVIGISGLIPRDPLFLPQRTFAIKYTRQFDLSDVAHSILD